MPQLKIAKRILTKVLQFPLNIFRWLCLSLVYFYRYCISPFFPASCRFQPTCSEYVLMVLKTLPLHQAAYLSLRRICRCQPFGASGLDFPPAPKK